MKIRVINLDRAADRYTDFVWRNAHVHGIKRFAAIDGSRVPRDHEAFEDRLDYTPGAKGNALSHIALWREVVTTGEPMIVVEDDAILGRDFYDRAVMVTQNAQRKCAAGAAWDIVMLGWNFDAFVWLDFLPGVAMAKIQTDQAELRANISHFQRVTDESQPVRLRHVFGLACYAISPSGAQRLLRELPLRNDLIAFSGAGVVIENHTLDCAMNAAYPNMNAFVAFPPLAVTENRHEKSSVVTERAV